MGTVLTRFENVLRRDENKSTRINKTRYELLYLTVEARTAWTTKRSHAPRKIKGKDELRII